MYVEQVNDFSPVCVLLCCFKTFDIVNDLSHFEQQNSLFPLWVLSWYNKPFDYVNVLSHAEQVIYDQYMFSYVVSKHLKLKMTCQILSSWMVLLHAEQLNQMAYGRHRCKICLLDHKTSTTHYFDPNYRGRTNLKQNPKQINLTF